MNEKTENILYQIWLKAASLTDCTTADRATAPLTWYVSTGRCTGSFSITIGRLSKRQITTVAKRLLKASGDYQEAIESIKAYINA